MHRSLHHLDHLPDDLTVYPTHGAGSFCSAPGSSERVTTLGTERTSNPLLQLADEDEFVSELLAGFGTFPAYFARLPELNRRGPRRYDAVPALEPLGAEELVRVATAGAVVVDARPFARFGAGHIPGSLSNALRPVFGSWLGWLVPPDRQLAFVLDADQDRDALVRQCLDVGHERLVGYLDGGVEAWTASGRTLTGIRVVGVDELAGTVIDVRQANEYVQGHVPGARNIELATLAATAIPSGPVTVMCGHGERAMTGASMLVATNRDLDVIVLDGGPEDWSRRTGRPLVTER